MWVLEPQRYYKSSRQFLWFFNIFKYLIWSQNASGWNCEMFFFFYLKQTTGESIKHLWNYKCFLQPWRSVQTHRAPTGTKWASNTWRKWTNQRWTVLLTRLLLCFWRSMFLRALTSPQEHDEASGSDRFCLSRTEKVNLSLCLSSLQLITNWKY